MFPKIVNTIKEILDSPNISEERKTLLQPLIDYVQIKTDKKQVVNLNFICTHNSRRSHLAQIWAQVAATHYNLQHIYCYSGGTEITELFPKVIDTLTSQGFQIFKVSQQPNPIYAVKYTDEALPIIGFSKKYDNPFNPMSAFAAIMTCSQADIGCPIITGAQSRIPITYEDPKAADSTPEQTQVYTQRSLQIATEMFYVFSKINV